MSAGPLDLCVLFGSIVGSARLLEKLDETEARRAVDRCLHRMERATVAEKGRVRRMDADGFVAEFDSAEAALRAAGDMQQRVHDLPPVSGMALAVRVGCHCGGIAEDGGPAGESVDFALRLAAQARPGQTLTSASIATALPAEVRRFIRPAGALAANGGGSEAEIFEAIWSRSDPAFQAVDREGAPLPAGVRLKLSHGERHLVVGPEQPAASMGRGAHMDFVIRDSRASRRHGRIEFRKGVFVLIDESTNGTYVSFLGGPEFAVRRQELALHGRGYFRCGHAGDGERLDFEIVE